MKKKLIISIAFIIILILSFFIIRKIYDKSFENEVIISQLTVKDTSKDDEKEKIVKSQFDKIEFVDNNDLISDTNLYNFYKKQISWKGLTNNVAVSKDKVHWYIKDEMNYLQLHLFTNNVTYSVTNLFDILMNSYQLDSIDLTNSAYSTALMSLRYRQLLPYVMQIIHQANNSSNRVIISKCITWLDYIQHPDTLRTILKLNKLIPEDSYLRKETLFGYLPFFYRKDCLDVYIEIADQPEKYDHNTWYAAAYNIGWFTNDIAISTSKRAYKTMKEFKKYWPESPDSRVLNVRILKAQMERQKNIMDGKKPPRKRPKPLLDE